MGSLRQKTVTKQLSANAELFEKKDEPFARWRDRKGKTRTAKLTTGRDGSLRIVVESGRRLAEYRHASGVIQEIATGCKDKGAAQAILSRLERRQELIRSGVVTSAENGIADHAGTPIVEHFAAYREHRVSPELICGSNQDHPFKTEPAGR
jgi:hypothetical protein